MKRTFSTILSGIFLFLFICSPITALAEGGSVTASLYNVEENGITIASEDNEELYLLDVSIPAGGSIDYLRDYYNQSILDKGVLVIKDAAGSTLGGLELSSTKDSVGNIILTGFIIEGNQVFLEVKHHEPYVSYPVHVSYSTGTKNTSAMLTGQMGKASTINLFLYYFYEGYWDSRPDDKGIMRLCLTLRPKYANIPNYFLNDAWNTVYNVFSSTGYWYNEESLYNQYVCHWTFAYYKSDWNLEPHRPVTSVWDYVRSICNP